MSRTRKIQNRWELIHRPNRYCGCFDGGPGRRAVSAVATPLEFLWNAVLAAKCSTCVPQHSLLWSSGSVAPRNETDALTPAATESGFGFNKYSITAPAGLAGAKHALARSILRVFGKRSVGHYFRPKGSLLCFQAG